MSALEESPGAFDPFRYAPPTIAAEIANVHILSALDDSRDGLTLSERLALGSGLKRGALNGARCVWDALKYVPGDDAERVRSLVEQQMEASSMFSLGIALQPLPRLDMSQRLTLVDFDRELGLPEGKTPSEYSVSERIALAAVRLVIRASLEILIANRSGVLIVDEAWTFLSQAEGLASLQRISREGRSLNIMPVFLTQRIADVVTKDLESYLSRVLVLKLNEKREAETALRLCGLNPTSERLAQIREFGPLPPEDGKPARWARGIFRDLFGRHAQVVLGPTPPEAAEAYSTNPEDRRKREEARREREEAERAEYEAAVAAAARMGDPGATAPPGQNGVAPGQDIGAAPHTGHDVTAAPPQTGRRTHGSSAEARHGPPRRPAEAKPFGPGGAGRRDCGTPAPAPRTPVAGVGAGADRLRRPRAALRADRGLRIRRPVVERRRARRCLPARQFLSARRLHCARRFLRAGGADRAGRMRAPARGGPGRRAHLRHQPGRLRGLQRGEGVPAAAPVDVLRALRGGQRPDLQDPAVRLDDRQPDVHGGRALLADHRLAHGLRLLVRHDLPGGGSDQLRRAHLLPVRGLVPDPLVDLRHGGGDPALVQQRPSPGARGRDTPGHGVPDRQRVDLLHR
ncbi:ATP-binding protein [Actinomadura luteofluorescens]|uniref:ATP-binding protein n=1 Tax=Actinomadura luteofluorescens TaxID=46163 RepID=UPI003633FDA3